MLVPDSGKYHFCVKAQRRTVFTNLDRVFTLTFNVSPKSKQSGIQCYLSKGKEFHISGAIPIISNLIL